MLLFFIIRYRVSGKLTFLRKHITYFEQQNYDHSILHLSPSSNNYVHDYLLLFMIPFRLMKYRLSLYRLKIEFQSLNLVEFRARIGNSLKSIKILHFLYLYFLCYGYIVCKRYLFEMYHWINMHETLFILSLISMTLFQYTLRLEFYFS